MNPHTTRAGAHRRPVFFILLAAAALFAASCYSSNYRREMLASVSLISELSDKLADYCRAGFQVDGRRVTSEEMGEFYYGLSKARAYQTMTNRYRARRSRKQYAELVDEYEKFVHEADRYRLSASDTPAQLETLLKDHRAVTGRALEVARALEAEPE